MSMRQHSSLCLPHASHQPTWPAVHHSRCTGSPISADFWLAVSTLFELQRRINARFRPVGLALYGRFNRKPIGPREAMPLRSAPSTGGIINI
eukprot:6184493-Pleurochrysis_carterae.AAC.2